MHVVLIPKALFVSANLYHPPYRMNSIWRKCRQINTFRMKTLRYGTQEAKHLFLTHQLAFWHSIPSLYRSAASPEFLSLWPCTPSAEAWGVSPFLLSRPLQFTTLSGLKLKSVGSHLDSELFQHLWWPLSPRPHQDMEFMGWPSPRFLYDTQDR